MKKILVLSLLLAFLFLTCKKDKGRNQELLLSKVYQDGLLTGEYIFSSDKKPLRRNIYGTGTGQSVFSSFRIYQYSATGLLEEITDFSKNNLFIIKYKLLYDVSNRPVRMDQLASDNSIQYYYQFDYTTGSRLSKFTLYNASLNKKTVEGFYTYGTGGNVEKVLRYTYISNNPVLNDSSTYQFNNKSLPSHWSYFEMLPVVGLPNGDRTFFNMTCDHSFYYYVDAPPTKTNLTFSAKEYNAEGYLIRQHVMSESQVAGPAVIANHDLTYEYMK